MRKEFEEVMQRNDSIDGITPMVKTSTPMAEKDKVEKFFEKHGQSREQLIRRVTELDLEKGRLERKVTEMEKEREIFKAQVGSLRESEKKAREDNRNLKEEGTAIIKDLKEKAAKEAELQEMVKDKEEEIQDVKKKGKKAEKKRVEADRNLDKLIEDFEGIKKPLEEKMMRSKEKNAMS